MGKDPGTNGAPVATDAVEGVHREIAQTRSELGETVATLARKTDVKAQAKHKLDEKKASISEKKNQLTGKAKRSSPEAATSAVSHSLLQIQEHPLIVTSAGALLIGFLFGRARPSGQ